MADTIVGYLINQYPKVSHSFIRSEILALERRGIVIHRFALRGWDAELVDPLDEAERLRTRYLLRDGAVPLVKSTIAAALRSPARFLAALREAWRASRGAEQGLIRHLIYFAEACLLLQWTRAAGVRHMHAHFGTNPAEVAMLAHALGGPSYSFTVHGPEEFDKPIALHLREKIAKAAFVVAITSFCRSQLFRWSDFGDWGKIKIVGCGIDDAFFDAPETVVRDRRALVCVGRICEQKGQLLLVESCRLLRDRGVAFSLTFAGDGEMRGEVEQAIAAADLGDRVHITGWLSSAEVRAELLHAAALVMPSFAEGLPVAIMEAMALKRPALTTYIGGAPELVRESIDGLLIPAGDVAALADSIERFLLLSDDDVAAMGERAHQRVRERHYIHTEAGKIAELFTRTIAASPPRPPRPEPKLDQLVVRPQAL